MLHNLRLNTYRFFLYLPQPSIEASQKTLSLKIHQLNSYEDIFRSLSGLSYYLSLTYTRVEPEGVHKDLFFKYFLVNINSVSARAEFLGVIDDPLFENLRVIGKFRGSELFCVIIMFYLRMHQYQRYLKNVPYRKIMVVSKFGACFTIDRLLADGFCYIFCFIGIMQCCVACS